MAGSSNSDDGSDIFWPGYVDAVTNLAINLLFVIAVMSIVVIGAVLQLSKMKPDAPQARKPEAQSQTQATAASTASAQQAAKAKANAAQALQASESDLQKLQNISQTAQKTQAAAAPQLQQAALALSASVQQQRALTEEMAQLHNAVQNLQERLAQSQSRERAAQSASQGQSASVEQVVRARDKVAQANPGSNQLQSGGSGVVVVFDRDVIELSGQEVAQLIRLIGSDGPLASSKWELRVAAQQGFSEAIRIAFYRLTSVRNALIANGVPAANIDMRVLEVASGAANNNRVQVRRLP